MMFNLRKLITVLVLILIFDAGANAQLLVETTNDPAKVRLIYEDLYNFLHALDNLESGSDAAAIVQEEYLDKASPAFREYLRQNKYQAKDFAEEIIKKKEQYSALRGLPDYLKSREKGIHEAFAGLKKIIPGTIFLPVYYFVGIGGGLHAEPSPYGLMIAISSMPTKSEDAVQLVLVHETIHVQQVLTVGLEEYHSIYSTRRSLLAFAIREGAAEFLTSLSAGKYTQNEAVDYFLRNEEKLWKRFQGEMDGSEDGDWMWRKPSDPEQPPSVGYVLGAKIVEAFYDRMEDKEAAVKEILAITNFKEFLDKSGYAEKFR